MDDATHTTPAVPCQSQASRQDYVRQPHPPEVTIGKHTPHPWCECGYVIPMVMMFLVIVSLIGAGLLTLAGTELELAKRAEASRQAFYLAEAGAQRTLALLTAENETWDTSPGAVAVFSEEVLQNGTYTVRLENVSADEATIVAEGTYPRTGALRTTRRVRLVIERPY